MIQCLENKCFGICAVILVVVTTGCWFESSTSVSSSDSSGWTFSTSFKSGIVVSSELTFKGKTLPSTLLDKGATIITSLGTFITSPEGYWGEATPGMTGSASQTGTDVHNITAEELSQGFYETSNREYGPATPWTGVQLDGTPGSWVYVFVETKQGYQGFWVDPEKIEDLPWR